MFALGVFWAEPLSDARSHPERTIFVGGPGRSGTSLVADRLGQHPQIRSFPDVELKMFTEKNGLIDLHHALVETYSPNRAVVGLDQFKRFFFALVDGRFAQRGLVEFADRSRWVNLLQTFCDALTMDGHPVPASDAGFFAASRKLFRDIAGLAAGGMEDSSAPQVFLEKTPHSLLAIEFLAQLSPRARFLHVMRDPRAIAFSLRKMNWGPDDLTECCAWVASYCSAWHVALDRSAVARRSVVTVNIEAIAVDSDFWSRRLCDELSLAANDNLFKRADLTTLNGWQSSCPADDLRLLHRKLSNWAEHFGYRATEIGVSRFDIEPSAA